jgi:hypothetical protein
MIKKKGRDFQKIAIFQKIWKKDGHMASQKHDFGRGFEDPQTLSILNGKMFLIGFFKNRKNDQKKRKRFSKNRDFCEFWFPRPPFWNRNFTDFWDFNNFS